ncbi:MULTISPECIES: acyl-CoA dehydrogenase family protein [unclassified Mycolicibacterium]|uniref:acyl-CoA dehydrogenase family protein n=1 Tax=unclassified Mycolicibacterium TaxID=2636767 RepID=UPI0013919637|nr:MULTISPECIES: acyl-CoA dehydrogenase family protein [unclassified Mycolicibacterium]MUM06725.1 hypothetical protein [Mycolicibacterium sp. CBMA 213]
MPTNTQTTPQETESLDELLSAEALSELMRSTWTWDDRALRRDLSTLLVMRAAASHTGHDHLAAALHAGTRSYAARFATTVLGPKLIADVGNPLRDAYLPLAGDPATHARNERLARQRSATTIETYFSAHVDAGAYPPQEAWSSLVAEKGTNGLSSAMRAYGHRLSSDPLFASKALAWQTVSLISKNSAAADYAHRLLADDITGTLAAAEESGSWDPALVRTRAVHSEDGWRLTGTKTYVPSADRADMIFVIGRSVAGPSLFAVEAGAAGMQIDAHRVLDDSRPLFAVALTDTPAFLIGREGSGGRLMSLLIDRATTALAAEQVGIIEAAISRLRRAPVDQQDLNIDIALNHAAAYALWRRALSSTEPGAAAAAHIGCGAAAVRVATAAAEVCADEDTAALLRRALSANLLFGGPAVSHERLLERLGI